MADDMPGMTNTRSIAQWAQATPDAIAVTENGENHTYEALAWNVARAVEMLQSAGLRTGMIVGIECDIQYLHLILILAAEVIGAVHMSIAASDLVSAPEIAARCDLLCTEAANGISFDHGRVLPLSRDMAGDLARGPAADGTMAMLEAIQPPDVAVRIGTTSGTTGRRKFMYNTRRSLWHIRLALQYILKHDQTRYPFVSGYRFLQKSTYGATMLPLAHGLAVHFRTREDILPILEILPGCFTFVVLRDVPQLVANASLSSKRVDSCSIRVIGGAMSPSLRTSIRKHLTTEVRGSYSSNETGSIALFDDGDVGTLVPDTEVRIVDETGQTRKEGEPGTIMVRSPRLGGGYLWDEDANARSFADGWFRTSDIGLTPAPGKIVVMGRVDDMLNIGGIKVAPYPLEEQIKSIDGVSDAVLLSLQDKLGIGELHVFIERGDPTHDERIGQALVASLRRHVSTFTAHYAARFPRTQTGKVQRNVLRARLAPGT